MSQIQEFLTNFRIDTFIIKSVNKKEDFLNQIKFFECARTTKKDQNLAFNEFIKANEELYDKPERSLLRYNKCILNLPKDSPILSAVYNKRSLALEHVGFYSEAIHDIDIVLMNNLPLDQQFELLLRKARCLTITGESNRATDLLNNINFPEGDEKMVERVNKILYWIKNRKVHNFIEKNKWQLPMLKGGENPEFPHASNCLKIVSSKDKRQHVIAKDDINVGDVLFVERPFAVDVCEAFCHVCCDRVMAPIPCLDCTEALFCSTKCRDMAWESYHKFECGYGTFFEKTGIARLALRILLKTASNYDYLKKQISKICKSERNENFVFSNDEVENLYNLKTHALDMTDDDLQNYSE